MKAEFKSRERLTKKAEVVEVVVNNDILNSTKIESIHTSIKQLLLKCKLVVLPSSPFNPKTALSLR